MYDWNGSSTLASEENKTAKPEEKLTVVKNTEAKEENLSGKNSYSSVINYGKYKVQTIASNSTELDDEPEETVRERLDYDLIGTGYDSYDLEWMDEDERNQVLEDNFLDPYDYDFDDLD